ncbi:MAG: hypothetical protein ABIN37_03850 [Burkholderiaceae bacterium]
MAPEYSIWLLPCAADAALLQGVVTELSSELGGPGFTPHVTIQGDIALPRQALEGALAGLAARASVQRWRPAALECGQHYFRCLYLRFAEQRAFAELQRASVVLTGTRAGLSPFPHVSLAYAEPHAGHEALAQTRRAALAGRDFTFDRLAIWRSSRDVAIPDWACAAQHPLQGGSTA